MKRYLRIPLLVVGYFLYIQAGLGVLASCGQPENLALIWLFCFGFAALGHGIIKTARGWQPKPPPTPDTQPLSAIQQAGNPTRPIEESPNVVP